MTPSNASLVWTSSTLAYLVFTPAAGLLSDRVQIRGLFALGMALTGTALLFMLASTQLWVLVAALVLVGAGMAFVDTPAPTILAQITEDAGCSHLQGSVFSLLDMATSLAFIVGPNVGMALSAEQSGSTWGMKAATWSFGFVCLAFIPVVGLKLSPKPARRNVTVRPSYNSADNPLLEKLTGD